MNKVITAFDGLKVSESTIDYAIYLSENFKAHIVAAFLEDVLCHRTEDYALKQSSEDNNEMVAETIIRKKEIEIRDSIKRVREKLNATGIHYTIHKDYMIALQSLVRESRLADMILINYNESFSNWGTSCPSEFVRDLLEQTSCPIMLVPNEFKPIEKFVFAYDGSASSTNALKLFSYLFREVKQEIEIVTVSDNKHSNHLPEQHLLKELLKRKYSGYRQIVIKSAHTPDALADYMELQTKNCMVILGAYERSSLSMWMRRSTADVLIKRLDIPLFIAHN